MLDGGVRAELRLGWFTCRSILVSPAADVLEKSIRWTNTQSDSGSGMKCRAYKTEDVSRLYFEI